MNKITTILLVLIFLASSTGINIAIAQGSLSLYSQGKIEYYPNLTIILRGVNVGMGPPSNIETWVDGYVANHSYANSVCISDMHQYGIWWYGYSFTQSLGRWMGWTFNQLKQFIDRFHQHGWKVGLESTGVAWNDQEEYYYIQEHKELAFTDANGMRATGIENAANYEKNPGYNSVIPDWFKNFTDNSMGVHNQRLIDVYTIRLKQMIIDGLQWDYWFGTDGWNGFNIQGYYWFSNVKSNCYSFSVQEVNEWGNYTGLTLPSNWAIWNNSQKANWIFNDATAKNDWWNYWQERFAEMYVQIRQTFIEAGRPGPYYFIGTVDVGTGADGGNLSPAGMWNITKLVEKGAVDYFYVDQEGTAYVGAKYGIAREQAYCAALAKANHINATPIIGLQLVDWLENKRPLWEVKQSYLAQAVNYIWYNGKRYRISDPTIIMAQYPNSDGWKGWSKEEENGLFQWIKKMATLLQNAEPVWLGPVYPLPIVKSGSLGMAWWGINFTFSQWAYSANLRDHPEYVNESMGTFLLDEALGDSGPRLEGCYSKMVEELWGLNKLNLWYYEARGMDWRIGVVWNLENSELAEKNFKISYNRGTSANYTVSNKTNIQDDVGKWFVEGFENTNYVIDQSVNENFWHGLYLPSQGFVTVASFTYDLPQRIATGYFFNSSTSRFLLTHMPSGIFSQHLLLPRDMMNKMLYWVSESPILSSESLVDLKILRLADGRLIVPVMNQRDVGDLMGASGGWPLDFTLNVDASVLGLGAPSSYKAYWQSNKNEISIGNWNRIETSLTGMADILVIYQQS
jgi:hypothetical protein